MSEQNETLAEIVAEMRIFRCHYLSTGKLEVCTAIANFFADRIEAAWKRQEQCYLDQIRDAVNMIGHERFVKEHPSVGNTTAMREALEKSTGSAATSKNSARHVCANVDSILTRTSRKFFASGYLPQQRKAVRNDN